MSTLRILLIAIAIALPALPVHAAPSGNVIGGGDFESLSTIKLLDSPRTQAEIDAGANPVRSWQFHPGGIAAETAGGYTAGQTFTDLGKWIGQYRIGTDDSPHHTYPWGTPGPTPNNRSLAERDGQTSYVMDGIHFHASVCQVIQAPITHVAGVATIDFSYWFNRWEDGYSLAGDSTLHVWIGGLSSLPTAFDRAGAIFGGNLDGSETGSSGQWSLSPLWDSPNWTLWPWSGIGSEKPAIGSQGLVWHELSSSFPSSATFTIDTPYPYYYISIYQSIASSATDFFETPIVATRMAAAIDNIDLRLPMALLGDCNLDGLFNALDISSFVQRLTTGAYQPEADCNKDGAVNALDIGPFVQMVIAGATVNSVPEPGTLALATMAAAGIRWRRP